MTDKQQTLGDAVEDKLYADHGVRTGSAFNEHLVSQREQSRAKAQVRGPGGYELGAGAKKFVGFGLLLLAWRTMPDAEAVGSRWFIPGFCFFLGVIGMIRGLLDGESSSNRFSSWTGAKGRFLRMLWILRPRLWLLTWLVILGSFVWFGSPHLRVQYVYATVASKCDYFGLNGWETRHYRGRDCPLVEFIPLR